MTRGQRFRWLGLGMVVGAALVGAVIVVLAITTSKNEIDAQDATKVANRWAAEHRRPKERVNGSCSQDAGGFRFVCQMEYRPTNRRFTLFLRKTAVTGDYSVVLSHVEPGIHPLPDFPDTVRTQP